MKIDEKILANLKHVTYEFIFKSYEFEYDIKNININELLEIKKIRCKTRNGLILPKMETQIYFLKIIEGIQEFINKYIKNIQYIHFPINIRVNSDFDDIDHKYNSKKPHLDCWAGEPENSFICSIQLLGDKNAQTIEKLKYIGDKVFDFKILKKYEDANIENDYISIEKNKLDNYMILSSRDLHKTSSGYGPRINLEIRYIIDDKIIKNSSDRMKNYIKYELFKKINNNNLIIENKYFDEFSVSEYPVDFKVYL